MRGCKNLEAFSMNINFDAEELKELLHCCPKLKLLCIRTRFKQLFKIVKNYGKSLRYLQIEVGRINVKKVKLDKLKKYFDGQFTQLTMNNKEIHGKDLMQLKEKKCCDV